MYRVVMISIDLSETAHFGYCQFKTKSETNFFCNKYFSDKNFFVTKNFSQTFSQAEFCLGLHTTVVFRMKSFYLVCLLED